MVNLWSKPFLPQPLNDPQRHKPQVSGSCRLGFSFIHDNVQGSSIDLTLGNTIKVETPSGNSNKWNDQSIVEPYSLAPGEFVLAHTEEVQDP